VIDGLATTNPGWAEQWKLSQGPRWAQMRELGYGLDGNTKDQWASAYDIFGKMTDQMAAAKTTKEKNAAYDAAMTEIATLKAANEEFAKQFSALNKETAKPTAAQLRAWGGDYTKTGKSSGGYKKYAKKGIRRGKRGSKKVKSRGGGIKAVTRTKGKKKLRVRRG